MSSGLSSQDLRALLDFVTELNVLRSPDGLNEFLVRSLPRIIPADITASHEFDPRARTLRGAMGPDRALLHQITPALCELFGDFPVLPAYSKGRGSSARLSDYVGQNVFRSSSLYGEVFRPLGAKFQLSKGLPAQGSCIASVSLLRSIRDFSDRDRNLLSLLGPHLNQAYRNAETYASLCRQVLVGSNASAEDDNSQSTLSRRETEVLIWARQGRSNRAIAQILGISELTVKKHLEHIYVKLGASNRVEAIARAFRSAH